MRNASTFFPRLLVPLLIGIIFLFGTFLRFYELGKVPVSLYWDETAFAYNAYSILHTARDEYGTFMPFLFRSFNDYKMPGNVYFSIIPIALFGLNEFSARFASAFFGSLTVLLSFFLIREMLLLNQEFSTNKKKFLFLQDKTLVISIATVSMLFLAISPWHLQFSRAGFEATSGLFFILLGGSFFFRFVRLKTLASIILSMISFGISVYFYRSILIFVPLLIIGLFIFFRGVLFKHKKKVIGGLIILNAIVLPFLPVITSKAGMIRSEQVGIQNNSFDAFYQAAQMQQKSGNTLVSRIIYNRRLVLGEIFIENYISHFSPEYLFFKGDVNGRHGPRNMGILYLWEIPFILIGIFLVFTLSKPVRNTVLLWILLAPLPAAVSIPTPHALRTLNMLPIPMFLTSLGVVGTYWVIKPVFLKKIFVTIITLALTGFFIAYIVNYYGYSARVTSTDWADGYKQLYRYTTSQENKYDKIVISGHYWNPYVYALFYKRYDPFTYQQSGTKQGFDKYIFGGTRWESGQHELEGVDIKAWVNSNNVLVALSPEEYQNQQTNVQELTRIYNHNNELVFIVGKLK